ncbi:MAG: hypothetical protein ACQEQ7_08950 [Thermodesulfobacteriota bacterium]
MLTRAWIINLVLAAAVFFFGIKAYGVWSKEKRAIPNADSPKRSVPVPEKTVVKMDAYNESEYGVVVSHNLFSSSRTPNEPKEEEQKPEPKSKQGPDPRLLKLLKATAKKIVLYGVLIRDGEKKVLIKSPELSTPKNRRSKQPSSGEELKWVKVGDSVNRFKVNEITRTGVILGAEDLTFDIVLYDENQTKRQAPAKQSAGPVVIETKGLEKVAKTGRPPAEKEAPDTERPEKEAPVQPQEKAPAPTPEKKPTPQEKAPAPTPEKRPNPQEKALTPAPEKRPNPQKR